MYSRSAGLHPTAKALANRAQALIKLRQFDDAAEDCTRALKLDPGYTKAYLRRATCHAHFKRHQDALTVRPRPLPPLICCAIVHIGSRLAAVDLAAPRMLTRALLLLSPGRGGGPPPVP